MSVEMLKIRNERERERDREREREKEREGGREADSQTCRLKWTEGTLKKLEKN